MGNNNNNDDGDDWLAAAVAWWQQRQNSKKPNTYNVPLSPSEQWQFDRQRELYNNSPARNYAYNYGHQYLQGGNSEPTSFKFQSPDMQGQQFAGGMTMPKIDFNFGTPWDSKPPAGVKPTYGGDAPRGPGQPNPAMPEGGGIPTTVRPRGSGVKDRTEADFPGGGGGPEYGETIADYLGRNPGDNDYRRNLPNGGRGSVVTEPDWSADPDPDKSTSTGAGLPQGDVRQAWTTATSAVNKFKETHPDWMKMSRQAIVAAATAFFGPGGGIVSRIAISLLLRGSGSGGQTPPPTGGDPFGATAGN